MLNFLMNQILFEYFILSFQLLSSLKYYIFKCYESVSNSNFIVELNWDELLNFENSTFQRNAKFISILCRRQSVQSVQQPAAFGAERLEPAPLLLRLRNRARNRVVGLPEVRARVAVDRKRQLWSVGRAVSRERDRNGGQRHGNGEHRRQKRGRAGLQPVLQRKTRTGLGKGRILTL